MRAGGALVAATPGYVLGRAALARRPDLDVWAGVALGAICFLLFLAARELSRLLPASVLRELDRMANKQTR